MAVNILHWDVEQASYYIQQVTLITLLLHYLCTLHFLVKHVYVSYLWAEVSWTFLWWSFNPVSGAMIKWLDKCIWFILATALHWLITHNCIRAVRTGRAVFNKTISLLTPHHCLSSIFERISSYPFLKR